MSQIRRAIGAFQKKKQEDYAIPDGAVLEADEAAMKTWKTQTPRGRVRWAADLWIGVVGRGSRKTSLYHIGTRYSKVKKRFPNIKNYIWGRIWKRFLMKRISNVATVTICTDGKPMYRPEKLRLGYRHYDVVHQKKQFWKKHKATGLQVGTQIIDRRWLALKTLGSPRTRAAYFKEDYVFAASWLYERTEMDIREKMREEIEILRA